MSVALCFKYSILNICRTCKAFENSLSLMQAIFLDLTITFSILNNSFVVFPQMLPGQCQVSLPLGGFHGRDTAKSTLPKNLPRSANVSHHTLHPPPLPTFVHFTVQKAELTEHTCNSANFSVLVFIY